MENLERLANSPCLSGSVLSIAYDSYSEVTIETGLGGSDCQETMPIQLRDLNLRRIEYLRVRS